MSFRSLEVRASVVATGSMVAQLTRIMFFIDRQSNATLAATADIMLPNTIYGMRNLSNRKRFKCIADKIISTSDPANFPAAVYRHWYIKFRKPLLTDYNNANNGTIADIASNAVYAFLVSNNAANAASLTLQCRMRYTDV